MYYLFISNKPIDMSLLEMTLNSVIEDEFDFVPYDSYSGHIETGFSISTFLKHQLEFISFDLGQSIKVLGTPKLDDLSTYLLKQCLLMSSSYLSLADAINISLIQNDVTTKQLFSRYFDHVNKELLDSILAFVEHGSNVLLVSKLLYIHRNTMNQRISKFSDITNLDLRDVEHNQLIYLYRLLKDNINMF